MVDIGRYLNSARMRESHGLHDQAIVSIVASSGRVASIVPRVLSPDAHDLEVPTILRVSITLISH